MPTATRRPAQKGTPQYRVLHCPSCHNVCFSLTEVGYRQCAGPAGCGHVWDAGEAGREVVWWRQ